MRYSPPVMLPEVTIHCPRCEGPVPFAFATYHKIERIDLNYFEKSKNFEVVSGGKFGWYFIGALYFHGLSVSLDNIKDLPKKYTTEMWLNTSGFVSHVEKEKDIGAYRCGKCSAQKRHKLKWPDDAYFKLSYKGKTLWAYDRSFALKLLEYIESNDRKKRAVCVPQGNSKNEFCVQDWFLRKIPEHFQTAKARPEISKKLRKVLDLPARALS